MQMYPAYKLRDVLDERYIVFKALLADGYRKKYQEYLMKYNLAALPYMRKENRDRFVKQLEWASKDPSDILTPSGDANGSDGISELKKMFKRM